MSIIEEQRKQYHRNLLAGPLTVDSSGIPTIADSNNRFSKDVSKLLVKRLGTPTVAIKAAGQSAGTQFEIECMNFIRATFFKLQNLRPGKWEIRRTTEKSGSPLSNFEQYQHLSDLDEALKKNSILAAAIGNDYTITPDIIISRFPETDEFINGPASVVDSTYARATGIRKINNEKSILHASISCKWTLRSDRAQNARSEALNLIRNRKGRVPHIVAITAEPTPSRISSIALGTGDIDCVYHFALKELVESVNELGNEEAISMLMIMIDGKRLKDISDLPLDLAI